MPPKGKRPEKTQDQHIREMVAGTMNLLGSLETRMAQVVIQVQDARGELTQLKDDMRTVASTMTRIENKLNRLIQWHEEEPRRND